MKKIKLMAIIAGCMLIFATSCLAQSDQAQSDQAQTGHMGHMMGHKMSKGDQVQSRCPMGMNMGNMPMCGMVGKTMVSTDDDGVIVMIGNTLYKYDKNLDLKKQTDIPVNYKNMKKMMMEMHDTDMTDSMHESTENDDTTQ